MPARTICISMAVALGALTALLAACGNGGGNTGGAGGEGGSGTTSTTGTQSTNSTTSTGSGSAPGCIELCTTLNACPGATMSDCATDCPPVDSLNQDANCTTQYKAFVKCVLSDTDPCTAAQGDCQGQAGDSVSCQQDFCANNPQHAGCS